MQTPLIERLEKAREQILSWSNERLDDIQSAQKNLSEHRESLVNRSSEALDAGRGAVRSAEASVLETTRDLLSRASETFGERATFLKRGEEALAEALIALRAGHEATLPIEGFDALSIRKIIPQLEGMDAPGLRTLRAYEASHKNRKTLLAELDSRLEACATPTTDEPASA